MDSTDINAMRLVTIYILPSLLLLLSLPAAWVAWQRRWTIGLSLFLLLGLIAVRCVVRVTGPVGLYTTLYCLLPLPLLWSVYQASRSLLPERWTRWGIWGVAAALALLLLGLNPHMYTVANWPHLRAMQQIHAAAALCGFAVSAQASLVSRSFASVPADLWLLLSLSAVYLAGDMCSRTDLAWTVSLVATAASVLTLSLYVASLIRPPTTSPIIRAGAGDMTGAGAGRTRLGLRHHSPDHVGD